MVLKKALSKFIEQNFLINNARRGIATTKQNGRYFDPHERAYPKKNNISVVTDIKNAFNLVKSGNFFIKFFKLKKTCKKIIKNSSSFIFRR